MIPRLASQEASFQGAFMYYFNDKGALSQNRIAWTETVNMRTDKIESLQRIFRLKQAEMSKIYAHKAFRKTPLKNPKNLLDKGMAEREGIEPTKPR